MNITCHEIQTHPASLGISDDDLCATCANLAYCPGEQSLCKLAAGDERQWPCTFDNNGYAETCERWIESEDGANWAVDSNDTTNY